MTQFSPETKEKIAELCRKHRVREICLFGSRVRDNYRPDSVYDFLVEFLPNARIGLIEYSRMQIDLAAIMQQKVDLVTKKGLKPYVRENVLSSAQVVYEA